MPSQKHELVAEMFRARPELAVDVSEVPEGACALLEELVTTTGYSYQSDFARRYFSAGKTEGKAEGEARTLLMVLEARGVDVPDLDAWARRAATANKIDDLFD